MNNQKILLIDIETAPMRAFQWSLWQKYTSINQMISDGYVLNWSAKWLGDDYVYSDSLHYHKSWPTEPENDKIIVQSIRDMLDDADVVVGHNVDKFDLNTLNGRMLKHGIQQPPKYHIIDTLKIARRKFRLHSNKLEYLGKFLGVGQKIDTGGFELWRAIIENHDREAFDRMVAYCEQDVFLLEEVFNKLRPWDDKAIPCVVDSALDRPKCNACGSEKVRKSGFYHTNTQVYQKYQCNDCGHNMRSRYTEKRTQEQRKNLLRSH